MESPNVATDVDLTIDASKPGPSVKVEPRSEAAQPEAAINATATTLNIEIKSMEPKRGYQQYIEAHEFLFAMYYNIAPKMSTNNIECALDQCERIVVLAKHYGSLPLVQPYLGNVLAQYHRQLYTSIAKDPPRWLTLSVALESNSIFREAIIHCAGCYPYSPWTTHIDTLPDCLMSIIKTKADGLAQLRTQTTMELFINTLTEIKDGLDVSLKTSSEAWIAVQIFHDWLGTQTRNLRHANQLHHGHHYRLMRKGGDAYLPTDKVLELLEDVKLFRRSMDTWDELETDLNSLKDYAKGVVEQITVDNLMVGTEGMDIPYLTCVDVGVEDYPWTRGPGTGA